MHALRSNLRRWVILDTRRCYLPRRKLATLHSHRPFDVLFLGRDEFSVAVLEQLHANLDVWNSIVVATHPDEKTGRGGSKLSVSPLKLKGAELELEAHFIPRKKVDFKTWLPPLAFRHPSHALNPVLVTASFGRMVPDSILHLFAPSRRLNVHPSLLPLYRGPAPLQHAIADGREEAGVSILEMKEKRFGADVGVIWAQKALPVPHNVRYEELRDVTGIEGGRLLVSVLKEMMTGKARSVRQDDSIATRAPFVTQETARVDFDTWDGDKLARMDRAIGHQKPLWTLLPSLKTLQLYSPQPFVRGLGDEPLPKPLQALRRPGEATYDPTRRMLAILCAGGSYVYVPSLQQQDKKRLEAQEWWKGVWPQWLTNKVLTLGSRAVYT